MAEVLRDLVVTLSLQSDNFTRNINSINRQIREAESSFRLAGAGIDNFGSSTAGINARLTMLRTNLGHQRNIVEQYERSLAQSNARLQESHARYQDYTARLDAARQKHQALGDTIKQQEAKLQSIADQHGKDSDAYRAEAAELDRLNAQYSQSGAEVRKLEGQCQSLQKAMQRDADAVSKNRTELNNAQAAVRETGAEIDSLSRQLQVQNSAWTQAGAALTAFSARMTAVGKSATMTGRRLTMTLTMPLVALGKKIIKATLDFEASFAYVRKTVKATEEEYEQLAEASRRMSTEIATSTTDINHVMATGGQLGIATEHIEEFARVMLDLANSSTDLDADTAATSLAKFANIMGTDQSLFKNIGSTVAELGNNFATTEEPIVTMAMRIAGAGKQIGLTEPQVLALAASLSSVGIQAQLGGSSMSKALINMELAAETGGQALKDFARVAGITEKQFVDQWKSDPVQVFQKFIEGLGKLDDEGASAIKTLDEIGISEIRLRDTLLRSTNASELFARAQKMANDAWRENTALDTMAAKKYSTLESRMTNLKNKAVILGQSMGDVMRPAIENVMNGVSSFIDKLQGMDDGQKGQILQFGAFAAAAGPVLLIFGKIATVVGKVSGLFGTFCTAVGQAGGGLSGLMSVLGSSPSIWMAVAAAVIYGAIKLYDWVSGAKMAREAIKALNDTAKDWKDTAADTFYGRSDAGLSFFGMTEDAFRNSKAKAGAREWFDGLLTEWSNGKRKTYKEAKQWTDAWLELNKSTRTELQDLQKAAKDSGYTSVSDDIQADIKSLDKMDKEITALIRKRQAGNFTDEDITRLQELISQREAIIVRYKLQPESETEGFQTILDKVNAEVARAQARSQNDADLSVYQNAVVAAAQGMATLNSEIDAQYDKQYALIQLMKDGAEKDAAMAQLNATYNEQRLEATREYAQTLAQVVGPVWNSDSMQQTGDAVSDLAGKLTMYDAAVKTYGPDSYQAAQALDAVKNAAVGLDEGSLTEYAAVLSQISELLSGGMEMEEIQAMFPEIDVSKALTQLASIKEFTSEYSSSLEGLSSMFGEGLAEEVMKIAVELDMTRAKASWSSFASDPGSITTDAIITGIREDENAARQQVKVDAVVDKLIAIDPKTGEVSLSVEGVIGYVTQYAESAMGVDVSGLTPDNVTAMVAAYKEMDKGADMSALRPDEITAYIWKYLEKEGVDTTGLTPDSVTAFVMAYQEVTGGALTTALTPDDITAIVTRYLEAEGVDMSELRPDQVEGLVSKLSEATGCDRSGVAQSLTGYITQYDDSEAAPPTPTCKLSIDGYDLTALQQFQKTQPITVSGVLRLGDVFETPSDALDAENTKFFYNGKSIPVNVVPAERLTAETIIAYDSDGALHVLIMPEVGTPEAVEEAVGNMTDKTGKGSAFWESMPLFNSTRDDVQQILNYADTLATLREQIAELKAVDEDHREFATINRLESDLGETKNSIYQFLMYLTDQDLSSIGQEAAQLMAALNSGELDPEQMESYAAELQKIYDLLGVAEEVLGEENPVADKIVQGMQAYDWEGSMATVRDSIRAVLDKTMPSVGNDASAGVGTGVSSYDFSGDTDQAAGNLESSYRTSLDSHSPSQRLVPVGNDVSAGVGQGIGSYDFSSDSSTAAGNLVTSLSGALSEQAEAASASARSVGSAISSGIAAGIRSGEGGMIQAMVEAVQAALAAAKAELDIHSPSGVFRREVGLMAMKGMGQGFLEGQKEQSRVIRNAARYLTGEAQSGIVMGNTNNDNRRTYMEENSVSLSGNNFYIRSEQDIHDLAVEIAALTRTQQRGRGLRLA